MGLLQEQMRRDMRVRGLTRATEETYVKSIIGYVRYFGISPDKLDLEHVLQYQEHLVKRAFNPRTINGIMIALKFL